MRVLVVSDNHGDQDHLVYALRNEGHIDYLIHLGDSEMIDLELRELIECPYVVVAGNCDYFSSFPKGQTVDLGAHRIYATHGHLHDVRYGLSELEKTARSAKADIVMFGHTHVPLLEQKDGITFLNPGSIRHPRQVNRLCSYAVMVIDRDDRVHIEIKYLED